MDRHEVRITLQWLADALGGRILAGDPHQEVGPVRTDTRVLQPGDFFVALRGSRFDGHDFIGAAFERGALGVLVDERYIGKTYATMVQARDTTRALQDLAHAVRMASGSRVIAITGSTGKTTTKEAVAEFLAVRYRVVRNKGNLNNQIGLPISLMQLRSRPDVAVMELGMNHAGEIRRLVEISDPDVRVWTNVGDAHLGFFESVDAIAEAKAEILEQATSATLLVCNADDERVMRHAAAFPGRTVSFGESSRAAIRAVDVKDLGVAGMRARVVTPAGERVVTTPLLGRGNLANVLAAAAVALEFGISLDHIAERAASLDPADRRGVVHRLKGDITLIDDSYNSSPTAMRRALEIVAREAAATRKVAVLGEMLELGEASVPLHEECGRVAAESGLGLLTAVGGPPARALAEAAIAAGMAASGVTYVGTSDEAASRIVGQLQPGDLVLVKGSRGIRTDLVVDRIVAEFG